MTELTPRPRHRASVFLKLLAVMLGMGLVIPVVVGAFFLFGVRPTLNRSAEGLMAEYMELLAASGPDLAAARRIGARHRLDLRYEGPRGTWSTSPELPAIASVRAEARQGGWVGHAGSGSYIVGRPDGSTYLFVWKYGGELRLVHDRMILALLAVLVAIVAVAHGMLRRALRPLRWLHEGFAKLGEGDLEVTVPRRTHDEFGELTEAFNSTVARVREMVRARDQLLLDVSHELRSPLTRMRVALALAPEGEHQRRLAANVAEMEAMVTELLELERLRQGRGLSLVSHDLLPIVREAVAAFEDRPPGAELAAPAEPVVLSIDPEKVRSALQNLLENACKYSLPDSRPTRIVVSRDIVGQSHGAVTVRIEDDGAGIPAEDLPSLFEPFFRVDRSRSRKTGGYGLGLSLCKRIMEAHGGSITALAGKGRGASFVLIFPGPA